MKIVYNHIEIIKRLNEKNLFGDKCLSVLLKNGKNRDFPDIISNLSELKKLFSEIGVYTKLETRFNYYF